MLHSIYVSRLSDTYLATLSKAFTHNTLDTYLAGNVVKFTVAYMI